MPTTIGGGMIEEGYIEEYDVFSIHGKHIKSYLPDYAKDSTVIREFVESVGLELDPLFQLTAEILLNNFAITVTDLTIADWEEAVGVATNTTDTLEIRKAKVISILTVRQRSRRIDMEGVIRQFLSGPNAYVLQNYTSVKTIAVSSISGFTIGQLLYIGTETANLVSINVATKEITVDVAISPYYGAYVSVDKVEIYQQFDLYTFSVLIEEEAITNLGYLTEAIDRNKPAHIGWRLYSYDGILGLFDDPIMLSDDPDTTSDVLLKYTNVG